MHRKVITVLEGSGILERHIVPKLAKTGAIIKIISHTPRKALYLKIAGEPGQISIIPGGNYKSRSLHDALENSDVILNLHESTHPNRQMIKKNVKLPILLGKIAKTLNIKTLIHFSKLNANKIYHSNYAYSKYEGEKSLHNEFPNCIIIRPSVLFDKNDNFLSNIKRSVQTSSFIPITEKEFTKLHPIYAGDIAKIILKIIDHPERSYGKILELYGKESLSLKTIILEVAKQLNKKPKLLSLSYKAFLLISKFQKLLSHPVLTKEQIQLLQHHNTIKKENNLIFVDSFHIKQYTLTEFIKNNLSIL